jgi:cytochrome c-type biogenesis protein CcmH
MKTRLQPRIILVLQVSLVLAAIFVTLGASDSNTRFERLGHQLMCQCGCSEVLLECNHVGCTTSEKMRGELTAMINGGDSDATILQKFVAKYGPVVLAAPTKTGFNRVAWIMPYLVLVLGMAAAIVVIRTWKRRRPLAPAAVGTQVDASVLNDYRKRVHQETEL